MLLLLAKLYLTKIEQNQAKLEPLAIQMSESQNARLLLDSSNKRTP